MFATPGLWPGIFSELLHLAVKLLPRLRLNPAHDAIFSIPFSFAVKLNGITWTKRVYLAHTWSAKTSGTLTPVIF